MVNFLSIYVYIEILLHSTLTNQSWMAIPLGVCLKVFSIYLFHFYWHWHIFASSAWFIGFCPTKLQLTQLLSVSLICCPSLYGATYSYTMFFIWLFLVRPYIVLRSATPCLWFLSGLLIDCFKTIKYFRFQICPQNHCIFSFRLFFSKESKIDCISVCLRRGYWILSQLQRYARNHKSMLAYNNHSLYTSDNK